MNEWHGLVVNERINDDWVVMMKKSVLHYVADDTLCRFRDNEEAQFDLLFTLITNYHVDEEITTADNHGNHVRLNLSHDDDDNDNDV